MTPRVLVMAKAPVAGRVKTRLGASVGPRAAAELAAAALLDTLAAAVGAVGPSGCELALDGDLGDVVDPTIEARLRDALAGWTVRSQRGEAFAVRLANAHLDAGDGPLVQIGMDTPQVDAAMLLAAAARLADADVALGPAHDGGWWVLGRNRAGDARALADVEMSTPTTGADTRAALEARGLRVELVEPAHDVDTVADAHTVAALAPDTHFARAWRELGR